MSVLPVSGSSISDAQCVERMSADNRLASLLVTAGMEDSSSVKLTTVPSSLACRHLVEGEADAALIPAFDLQTSPIGLAILPAACISFAGKASTIRVFSRFPPRKVQTIWTDDDSKTSAALAQIFWWEEYSRDVRIVPHLPAEGYSPKDVEAVLLADDRLLSGAPAGFHHQLDLSAAWFEMTGLPLVTYVWVAAEWANLPSLYAQLIQARYMGRRRIAQIARHFAQENSCSAEVVEDYLTNQVQTEFGDAQRDGLEDFFDLAMRTGIIDEPKPLNFYQP